MARHSEKSLARFHGALCDGWNIPAGATWYSPPPLATWDGSRHSRTMLASPASRSARRVSVVTAVITGRRRGSAGLPILVRSGSLLAAPGLPVSEMATGSSPCTGAAQNTGPGPGSAGCGRSSTAAAYSCATASEMLIISK
jgi:hypothetical protein